MLLDAVLEGGAWCCWCCGCGGGGVALGVSGGVSKVVLPGLAAATVELLVLRGEATDFLIPEFDTLAPFRVLLFPIPTGIILGSL